MFGEVMGKTKNQLRREIWKMRLRQMKKHIPAIVGAVGTIAATAVAVHYKNEFDRTNQIDEDYDMASIKVPMDVMKFLEDGQTLHYRHVLLGDNDCYAQYSTTAKSVGFDPESDERFNKVREEGVVD